MVFTDWSAFRNPCPKAACGMEYVEVSEAAPILLKKGVIPYSNNLTGELVGIQTI